MNVRQSSLTYRFYTSDGWTRELVASYMVKPNIKYVFPRWYDMDKDSITNGSKNFVFDNVEQFQDCDYFAIHSLAEDAKLDFDRLSKEHNVIPFSLASSGF